MQHDQDKGHSGMMWMMLICCAMPLAFIFLGGGAVSRGGYLIPSLIGVLVAVHVWMMFRAHRGGSKVTTDASEQAGRDNEHKRSGSCH